MAPTADMASGRFQCQILSDYQLRIVFLLSPVPHHKQQKPTCPVRGNKKTRIRPRFSIFFPRHGEPVFRGGLYWDKKAFNINTISLGNLYGPGGYIRVKAIPVNSPFLCPVSKKTCQKIMFRGFQQLRIVRKTGGHHFRDTSFHNLLGEFGIFQLIAYGYLVTRPDQLREIGIQRMVGKTGQFHRGCGPVCPARKNNTQSLGRLYGIFPEGFIKIPYPEKQQGIGIFCLYGKILVHQWGLNGL